MPNTITTDLSTVITKTTENAKTASEANSEELTLNAQIKDAEKRVETAGQQLTTAYSEKQDVDEKLSPPPMKTDTASSGGKGKHGNNSKQVVDEKEKDRLESQSRAADTKIQQAAAAAITAKQEAGELTTKVTQMGEISKTDQQKMDDVTTNLDDLKKMAKDSKTDLTGEAYQKKLNDTLKSISELNKTAENGDSAEFWETTTASLKELDAAMDEYLDIDAPPINSQNNYASFFQQTETEFTELVGHLEEEGIEKDLIQLVNNSLDGIMNNEDKYLSGLTSDDKALMGEMLRQVLVINDKFTKGEEVTAKDINDLIMAATNTQTILGKGGTEFASVARAPIDSIEANLDDIQGDIDDPEFNEFMERLTGIYGSGQNSIDDLVGIKNEDMDSIFAYAKLVRDAKADDNITPSEIDDIVTAGNAYLDLLVDEGMVDPSATTSGTGAGSGSGSGSNNGGSSSNGAGRPRR